MQKKLTQKMKKQNLIDIIMDQQHTYRYACIAYQNNNQQQALMQLKLFRKKEKSLQSHSITQIPTHLILRNQRMKEFLHSQTYTLG